MRKLMVILPMMILAFAASAMLDGMKQLEEVLHERDSYVKAKESRIEDIKRKLTPRSSAQQRLQAYDELYREYLTFRFDSAMVYVDKAEMLLGNNASYDEMCAVKIHRALSLATSGHFSQAVDLLEEIDSNKLSTSVKREYFDACQWTYGVWGEYSGNTRYGEEYNRLSIVYLDSLLANIPNGTSDYYYHLADQSLRYKDYEKASEQYIKALKGTRQDTRLYAQAAYGLAMAYKGLGNEAKQREWLINAAISDQVTPLKGNLALQELALIIKKEDGDIERANRFLKYSLEDAMFYNNRLRILEISEKIPDIVIGYQDTISSQNRRLKIYVLCIGILLLGMISAIWIIVRQKKKVYQSRQSLSKLNGQLKQLNQELAQTNASREQYVSLFMDLSAAYIEKLNRFQSTVVLKIKARQFDDLLRVANNNSRPSEAEMRELFFNFDTAFLKLYPDFIVRFNSLLQQGKEIYPKQNELLNTDLRIFALIRMGIRDSNKIATLLFYSPQTIFNHRTQVRNRAKNRDTFEQELMEICAIVPNNEQKKENQPTQE